MDSDSERLDLCQEELGWQSEKNALEERIRVLEAEVSQSERFRALAIDLQNKLDQAHQAQASLRLNIEQWKQKANEESEARNKTEKLLERYSTGLLILP